jgi:Ca-activated chloride channel family protein
MGTLRTLLREPITVPASGLILILTFLATFVGPVHPASGTFQDTKRQDKKKQNQDQMVLHSDLVVVNATVTDGDGNYAHGLTAKDFTVTEDVARQTIDTFSAEEAPFAAAILLDMSASMETKFGMARGAAAGFLEQIREDDQVSVYGFNIKVRQIQEFSNLRDITDYVWDLRAEDNTRLYDCMDQALDALAERPERRRAIVLISDGADTRSSKASRDSVLKKAFASGVTIYTIDLIDDNFLLGSGSAAAEYSRGRKELQEFARQSGGNYIHTPQGEVIDRGFTGIVEELRNQYTITYYSTNNKRDGRWRALAVRVARPGLSVRTRKGYYAPKD